MSNGIREMKNFIKKVHKMKRNINDSAYLGDLVTFGIFRNRMFGNMIGKGYTVKSAMMEMSMVAEGYYAAKVLTNLIRRTVKHQLMRCTAFYTKMRKPCLKIDR
jgi:glycerol-3-phosphate dehydrogenase